MMVRQSLLALGLALTCLAESTPDEDPLSLLINEFAAAKKALEPFQPLLHRASGNGQVQNVHGSAAAVLKVQKQAASVNFAAVPEDNSTLASSQQAAQGPQAVDSQAPLSTQERRRLWTLLSFPSGPEMVVLSRLSSPGILGRTLEGWCKGASSVTACKHENNLHQYCQLARHVAPYLAGPNRLRAVAMGLVEDEAATIMQAERVVDPKDSALMDDITGTPAFKRQLESACEGLTQTHPRCEEVAKEVLYCQVIAKASLKLATPEVLVTRMHKAFMKIQELHHPLPTA